MWQSVGTQTTSKRSAREKKSVRCHIESTYRQRRTYIPCEYKIAYGWIDFAEIRCIWSGNVLVRWQLCRCDAIIFETDLENWFAGNFDVCGFLPPSNGFISLRYVRLRENIRKGERFSENWGRHLHMLFAPLRRVLVYVRIWCFRINRICAGCIDELFDPFSFIILWIYQNSMMYETSKCTNRIDMTIVNVRK